MRNRFERVRWQKAPVFDAWLEDVAQARTRGYAVDPGYFRIGVTSIAVGVPGKDGSVWRTVSISVVSAQLDAKRTSTYVKALRATADGIATAMR
jgi:DNA-binding IclR family transcriptional regulator